MTECFTGMEKWKRVFDLRSMADLVISCDEEGNEVRNEGCYWLCVLARCLLGVFHYLFIVTLGTRLYFDKGSVRI